MLRGGYAVVQQALVAEAAAAVWHAANLARRCGHAQVTPLHVASAMLSSGGLLRAACLRSSSHCQSHQLRHEALQLCLDVALGRLPMAWPPGAAMIRHHVAPVMALSNALVAALKRAQTHERRGSTDGSKRQPAMLAVKVGLKQLVMSILDDPSVDRVMREAGFSGSQVKANIAKVASSEQPDRSIDGHRSDGIASPCLVSTKATGGQPSPPPGTVWDVLGRQLVVPQRNLALSLSCHSGDQACQTIPREGWPVFLGLTEVATTTASIPAWLLRQQDDIPTCCSTSLQPTCLQKKFVEVSSHNLKILCDVLERRVPWQKNVVPAIAATVLRCRSGMTRRPASSMVWMLFRGKDVHGKMTMAQELAKIVFGSYTKFTLLNAGDISSSTGGLALKRRRSENGNVGVRLFEAIMEKPHRVVFINNIDQLDRESEIAMESAMATGRMMRCNDGGVASLDDAIVVLSLSSEASGSRPLASSSPPTKRQQIGGLNREESCAEKQESRRFLFDLNVRVNDVEEEEEENSVDSAGIMGVVDGIFHFD